MSQQSFIWRGPAQAVSLLAEDGKIIWEGALVPDRGVSGMPADHPHVAQWIRADLLEPVAEEASTDDPQMSVVVEPPAAEPVTRRRNAREG